MNKIDIFFQNVKDKKVAFIGMGVTNLNCIKMFLNKGVDCTVCDKKSPEQLGEEYGVLKEMGAKFILGEDYLESLKDFDIVFRTPGMYYNNPTLTELRKRGVVITSEMETFFELCPCKVYGITGSDGKTTTTTIISEFLSAEGKVVYKGGNIGRALLPIVEEINYDDVAVVELSSFQLLSMRESPDVAVITNVAPNHLDVHGTMDEYIDAKKNLIAHQNAFSKTVLNLDNDITNSLSDMVRGKLVKFSRTQPVECGAFLDSDGYLCYNDYGTITKIMHKDQIRIPGIHNVENYLTAISAVWGEVSIENMVHVAETFNGVEHRIEFVRELDGVKYYNDSIATSPTRVLAGLNSFNQKLIVIAGGYDKKIPFEPLAKPVNAKVKDIILLGVTADKIEKAVTECEEYKTSGLRVHRVSTLEEAVAKAREIAQVGDVVTLSPACASFDQYPNFEKRGEHYKSIVNGLK
jgi:UDP-N-acetylmuramoylalanine--D-glutamate ligase